MKKYRFNVIFDVRNTAIDAQIEKATKLFETLGATIDAKNDLGVKDFVRVTDRRMPSAHYVQFDVTAPETITVSFREKLRLDRTIKRIMVQAL